MKNRCNTGKFPTEFIINNKSITDHKEIANQFNIFFSNIGSNLSASIELDDNTLAFTDYFDDPTEHRFNFSKVTENEMVVIINNLKSKNSSGKDGISNKLLKSIKGEISKPLTIIINQCLETGFFPDALKVAKKKLYIRKETVAASIIIDLFCYFPLFLNFLSVLCFLNYTLISILIICYQNNNTVLDHSIQRN